MTDINPRAAEHAEYRQAIRELCAGFDGSYWRSLDERAEYPEAFVAALGKAGWLSALIPEEYGGGGLGPVDPASGDEILMNGHLSD